MKEFGCPCCGDYEMDMYLLGRLDKARERAGVPFQINSGYRCAVHNEEVGGSSTSSHLDGCAVDIACNTSKHRHAILRGLIEAGFTRIGIGKTFIHADLDLSKDGSVIWLY